MDTYIHADDQPRVLESIVEAVRTRSMFELEHRVVRADGTPGWTQSRAVPIMDDKGNIFEWIGTASDVTLIHEADLALYASEERLRSAIEVARVGMWDWNMMTGQVSWSAEHFRMMGFAPGDVTPSYESWAERVHPDDRPSAEAAMQQARDTRQSYVHEYRALHPDGSVHWLSARGRYIYDSRGEPVRMIGAQVDITEARVSLERQEILVGELQHRTRNLMSVVRSVADKTMRRAGSLDEFGVPFRERLEKPVRMAKVIDAIGRMTAVA